MKVTINTVAGIIQIHGSFTYGEYKDFMETIPEAWKEFKFEQPEVVRDSFYPYNPPFFPSYPFPILPPVSNRFRMGSRPHHSTIFPNN